MFKIALALVLLFTISSFAVADDALVLPAKVIRVYATGAYATVTQKYDASGTAQAMTSNNNITAGNVGAAVEFGVTDWITAAAQWGPGYNFYSKIDNAAHANLADAADLFVGAKLQIVGPKAPIQNDMIRFAIAPGVKFPLGTVDWKTQYANYTSTKDFLASAADKHALAVGGRAYLDYVINKMFFLNLYSQFLYYPIAVNVIDTGLSGYGTVSGYQVPYPTYNPTYNYGYALTLEFEPHFDYAIGEGLNFSAGLPVTYSLTPVTTVSGDSLHPLIAPVATNLLSIGPNVSIMTLKTLLPLQLKVGYTLPLMGMNSNATNSLVLQFKVYAKF